MKIAFEQSDLNENAWHVSGVTPGAVPAYLGRMFRREWCRIWEFHRDPACGRFPELSDDQVVTEFLERKLGDA